MRLVNFPTAKYVDSLHTSNLYEECVKHGKSRYSITGLNNDTAYLNEEPPISEKVVQHPFRYAKIFPRPKMLFDYLHVEKNGQEYSKKDGQQDSQAKRVYVSNTIDYLTDGNKVKFR